MLTYKKLARKPRSFQSFTGISLEQFDFLSSEIEKSTKEQSKEGYPAKRGSERLGQDADSLFQSGTGL